MTALAEIFPSTSIHNVFSWPISTLLCFSQIRKPILDTPIHNAMKETWLGMVRVDQGGLRNLAEWVWSACNKGGTVPKSEDLALGTDHDVQIVTCTPSALGM